MSYLSAEKTTPPYIFVLFKKVGTYNNDKGELAPVMEAVRVIDSYQATKIALSNKESDHSVRVSRSGEDHFENFADVLQRRADLDILIHLTHYSNHGEVFNADDFLPLAGQLRFPFQDLLDNYRSVLSEDDKENRARLVLLELVFKNRSRHITVQDYLDKVSDGWHGNLKEASAYLRLFESQGFIEISDYFTILPKKVTEFYDSHFETRLKSGKW